MRRSTTLLLAIFSLLPALASAEFATEVSLPMSQQGSGGFYVRGVLGGDVESELLVDTGSSYVVLSRDTFMRLKRAGATSFARTIHGKTAAGRSLEAKVYAISELALSADCVLRDVEAVVLPNADRNILGLSALRRLQPFALNFEPAELTVSTSACSKAGDMVLAATAGVRPR